MASDNGEEIQCQSSQEVSGMALAIVLKLFKEKRGFFKKNSCNITIPWIYYFSSTPMAHIYSVPSWQDVTGS